MIIYHKEVFPTDPENVDSPGYQDPDNHGEGNLKGFKIGDSVRARDVSSMPWNYGLFAGYNDRDYYQWHLITTFSNRFVGYDVMEKVINLGEKDSDGYGHFCV